MSLLIHQAALDNPAMSNALKATGLDKGWTFCLLTNMELLSFHQIFKIVSQARALMAKFHQVDSWLQSGLWMISIFSIWKKIKLGKGEKSFHLLKYITLTKYQYQNSRQNLRRSNTHQCSERRDKAMGQVVLVLVMPGAASILLRARLVLVVEQQYCQQDHVCVLESFKLPGCIVRQR